MPFDGLLLIVAETAERLAGVGVRSRRGAKYTGEGAGWRLWGLVRFCLWRVWGLGGVLVAASVGRTLSPPASVVVLLKSDFLAYFC